VLAGGSTVTRRRHGVAEDLEGVTGKVPGKEEWTEAHRNSGSMVRRCQQRRAAAFVDGEGSPVVADVPEEVLQLRRGKGVRKLQKKSRGLDARGRAHRGDADGGGDRPKFVRERRAPVARGGGPGAGSGGKARALERVVGEG
jgi:hypothetical protein